MRASTSPIRSLCLPTTRCGGEPGAIITPHNSGKFSLPKTLDNIVDIFIHNLKRYAEGLPLDNQVNRTTRYAADQNGGHRLLSTL